MRKRHITELARLSAEEFQEVEKLPVTIVLDNVRSLNNIGSIFRTSDAFRVKKIMLCGITATPPHPDIHKTALGAEFSVSWEYFKDTTHALEQLRKQNTILLAIEQVENSITLQDFTPQKNREYAFILGNEVKGVQQEVVDMSNNCIEIPQYGTKHSLNVSIATGIVIWDFITKTKYWFH